MTGEAGTAGERRHSAEELRLLSLAAGERGLRHNERRYRSLVEATTSIIWLADADGRLISDIPAWREFTGQTPGELLGEGWLDAVHPEDRERVARAWREAVASRSPYDVEYRICSPAGDERRYAARAMPVPEPDGTVREWIGFCLDRTDESRAREVEQELQAALDSERRILEQVIAQAPTAVAVLWGPEHRIRFFNERYLELVPPGRVKQGRALAEAFPEVTRLLPIADRARAGEALRSESLAVPFQDERSFEGFRYYDVTYTPLPDGDEPGGVLVVATETTDQVRRRNDLQRRLDEQRRRAEELQHALLPEIERDLPGLDVAVRYLPGAEGVSVGGDWYDVVPLSAERVALAIGDVGGRGLTAARTMGQLRASLRAYLVQGLAPSAALAELAHLCERLDLADMVTVGVGVVDLSAGTLIYANAGHLPPLVWRPDADAEFADVHRGPPIGAPLPRFEDVSIDLPPGSYVALFTDGLVERRSRSLGDSLEELRTRAARLRTGPPERCEELLAIALGSGPLDDDVALLVCRVGRHAGAGRAEQPLSVRFPAEPASLAAIRRRVAEVAARAGLDGAEVAAVRVAVTEAATNAIVHAYPEGTGELEVTAQVAGDAFEVVVVDSGRGPRPRVDSAGLGLGMPLMAGMAKQVEITARRPGTAVRLVFGRARSA